MSQIKLGKIFFFVFILLMSTKFLFGQKTEINLNAYSGLFSFRGYGSNSNSWINFSPYTSPQKYTSNPYGRKSGFSYALELQGEKISKAKNIYGIGISLEILTSKVNIDTVTENGFLYWQYAASGTTALRNSFVTLSPLFGHRFFYGKIGFDLLIGPDLAFCLKSNEKGKATTNGKDYINTDNNKPKPSIDFRPRLQIIMRANRFAILSGYSFGVTNYQIKNNKKAYSNFLRLGFGYQLK